MGEFQATSKFFVYYPMVAVLFRRAPNQFTMKPSNAHYHLRESIKMAFLQPSCVFFVVPLHSQNRNIAADGYTEFLWD